MNTIRPSWSAGKTTCWYHCALASNPKVLLCDEATSALDPQTTGFHFEIVKKTSNEKMVLTYRPLITYEMHVIREICDRVAVIEGGVILEEGISTVGGIYTSLVKIQQKSSLALVKGVITCLQKV